ncbi:MAG: hypothetical protein LLG16_06245 [Euryarchaeota archaeon]|nr:hypothetical protein [Euryarchaeota archaeon]
MNHGKLSAKIGKKIAGAIKRAHRDELMVFYDSGEKSDGTKLPLYYGVQDPLGPTDVLAEADIVVADTVTNAILIICKFGVEDAPAANVLGDMAVVLAAEKMKIKGRDFTTDKAHCLLGYRCEETKQEGFGMSQKRLYSYGSMFAPMLCDERRRGVEFTLIARKEYDKIFEEMQRVICHRLGIDP